MVCLMDRPDGPRLLLVAHGTASPAGQATLGALVDAVRTARPAIGTALCFLDVIGPRLADALEHRPTILVPLLLSTGYHVESDIPVAVADHPATTVARHLGPDPRLVDVLVDRLPPWTAGREAGSTVLAGSGSSRPGAAIELAQTARLLGERLDTNVVVLTMGEDLPSVFGALPQPVRVATYLLAEGYFVDKLATAAIDPALVAAPLGVHPSLVDLVWDRYDEALASRASDGDPPGERTR